MRAVSFVQRLEFEFKGNISKNALCLGDVDNDENCELAVGNLLGDLAIFKGEQCQPWMEAHNLGMIMVIIVGDILNEGKNFTICISGEGQCNIFEIKDEVSLELDRKNLQPIHVQKLPANAKVALLADVDNDGELELVLGLTDYVLRTYRWVRINQSGSSHCGKLIGLHKLELADQIGSISTNPMPSAAPYILIAQSGGTYIDFQCCIEKDANNLCTSRLTTPQRHTLASSRMRNPDISSVILGGIKGIKNEAETDSLIAIATLDGTLMLVDKDEILWSFQVDHQLFVIKKMDLIGDGKDELIACAWDGLTYILNQERHSIRFQFDEHVSSFTCGKYSLIPGSPVTAFVYGTFTECVYLYYDINLPSFRVPTLTEVMEKHPQTEELLQQFPINAQDPAQLRSLYSACLYRFPQHLMESGNKKE